MINKFRTLMINDNPTALTVMQNLVRHHRLLRPSFADTADKALGLIKEETPFHIIVSDISASSQSNIEVLKTAKSRSPDTKVVIITGFGDHQAIIDAIKTGVYGYLHKPYRPEELNLVLNNLTKHFQQVDIVQDLTQEISDLETTAQQKFFRIQELEERLAALKQELKSLHGEEEEVMDLNSAIAKAAAEKTGTPQSYDVFRELNNLNNLLDDKKITREEFQEFRRNVLEKAYQVPIST